MMAEKRGKSIVPTDEERSRYGSASNDGKGAKAGEAEAERGAAESTDANASGETESAPTTPSSPEQRLAALERERDALKDRFLRAQAECVNVSKRLRRQHSEAMKLAGMDLARGLLPVFDSLERTLLSLDDSVKDDPVRQGVELIRTEFLKVFREHGIVPIEAEGKPFEPSMHEALMQDRETDLPAGTVTRELQRGYKIHDRVLRPAKVAVAARAESEDETTTGNRSASDDGQAAEQQQPEE